MTRPTVVDVLAGVGGLSLGFEQAGFDVVAAVEIDPVHAATHAFNFPNCRTLCVDATKIRGEEIRRELSAPIDVVVGGAPCQGFSMIGKRALDDPRNQLVRHFLRLVIELEPSIFVLENVRGLTVGKHRQFLDEVTAEFRRAGYSVTLPWQVLNARDYGVPQDRQRLFLLGTKGARTLQYPLLEILTSSPTCRDALDDLPNAEDFEELASSDSVGVEPQTVGLSHYARAMRCINNDAWHYGYIREWDPRLLTASMRTAHTDISRRRFRDTRPGTVEPISRFYKLAANGVSNTLRAGTDSARGAFTSPRPIHYRYDRCVTVREMARLHGFPDWFRFHVTKWHGARQIGNSVPPPLAKAVAVSVRDTLAATPSRPPGSIQLGTPNLLRMDMTQAAAHWGVAVPIGRRDRKSGAKKRKQQDIERARIAATA
ncbi:MAG: DNA cytosine methyltransferase [Gammaproteobacteria bacterium]|nr:DNA cytosine methyltransferase [Gammaproteobacteria bacterium]